MRFGTALVTLVVMAVLSWGLVERGVPRSAPRGEPGVSASPEPAPALCEHLHERFSIGGVVQFDVTSSQKSIAYTWTCQERTLCETVAETCPLNSKDCVVWSDCDTIDTDADGVPDRQVRSFTLDFSKHTYWVNANCTPSGWSTSDSGEDAKRTSWSGHFSGPTPCEDWEDLFCDMIYDEAEGIATASALCPIGVDRGICDCP
jgi:hypothetical protein